MKYSLKVDKLTTITVDNKAISVNELPSEIRYEIETLDLFRQNLRDVALEYEKAEILVRAKQAHVEQLITHELQAKIDSTEDAE